MFNRVLAFILLIFAIIFGCTSQFISSGVIYMQQNDLEKALNQFQLAVKNEPNNPDAYLWLGKCYSEMREYEKASDNFIIAMKKDESGKIRKEMKGDYEFFWAVLFNAGTGFQRNNDAKEKLGDYENYLTYAKEVKDTFLNYNTMILLYASVNDKEKIVAAFEKALSKYPDNISALFNMAKYYIDNADYPKAKDYLIEAKKLEDDNPSIIYYLGLMYYAMNENNSALSEFANFEKLFANMDDEKKAEYKVIYQDAIFKSGEMHLTKKDYKNAIIYFDKAYQLNENDADALFQLVQSYYLAKNFSKAVEAIEKYITLSGNETSYLYLIKSDSLNRMKKPQEALKAYEKYEELEKQGK